MNRPLVVLLVGALACREPAPVPITTNTVDSAGIQVVTSSASGLGRPRPVEGGK